MPVYHCTDHAGVYSVGGVASIVRAPNLDAAYELLDKALREHGLRVHADHPYTLQELPREPGAHVLLDGDDF
jgi:hypothetical protein